MCRVSTRRTDGIRSGFSHRAHSETAATEARRALDGIRATVGLLREPDGPALAPLPGYGDIPQLLDEMRERGTDITLAEPPPVELGATASAELRLPLTASEGGPA